MRKNILALSITAIGGMVMSGAAFAGVQIDANGSIVPALPTASTAVNLAISADGAGHILLVPYFTVQNGNATLINLVNTDKTFGKAVKVRFRGAANSDDVFDFQVFLSPGDVWSANVSKGADGRAALTTTDKSCTLPKNVNTSFVTDRLPSTYTAAQKALQTNEGYVEIFNMGDIPKSRYSAQTGLAPSASSSPVGTGDNPLYQAIKHVGGVAPCNSTDSVVAAQAAATLARTAVDTTVHDNTTTPSNAAFQGLALPSTGLFANWTIVNVPGTLTWTGTATAIVATTSAGTAGVGNLVMHPQTNALIGAAAATARTSDPLLAGGFRTLSSAGVGSDAIAAPIQAALFDFPDLSTPYIRVAPAGAAVTPTGQALQLTQSLAATSFINEYLTEPTINAKTDWVFSAPTRRYSVGLNYAIVSPDTTFTRVFSSLGGAAQTYLFSGNTSVDTGLGQICVLNINPTYQDREENVPVDVTDFVISPGALGAPLTFCGEVSVLSFNNTAGTSVLGALIARKDIDLAFKNGWATIATPGNGGNGLAVIGASFMSAFNGNATPGVSGNYGLSFQHRYERVAPVAAPTPAP